MSLFITSLNSGSNGNCYYVGTESEAVLVDVGISCRQVEKRMSRLGLKLQNVKAIFISHEHSDHINGLESLIKKYHFPVYITPATLKNGGLQLEENLLRIFTAHQPVFVGDLEVTAFPKFHDAADPFSFIVSSHKVCIGIFTDIGTPCKQLIHYFQKCHAAFLEANYDDKMLEDGNYPFHLKKRIRGGKGHLSNQQALELFTVYRPEFMSHILLSHLSQNNNSAELVEKLFSNHAGNVKIIIASRYGETELLHIKESAISPSLLATRSKRISTSVQLAFSFS